MSEIKKTKTKTKTNKNNMNRATVHRTAWKQIERELNKQPNFGIANRFRKRQELRNNGNNKRNTTNGNNKRNTTNGNNKRNITRKRKRSR